MDATQSHIITRRERQRGHGGHGGHTGTVEVMTVNPDACCGCGRVQNTYLCCELRLYHAANCIPQLANSATHCERPRDGGR